MKVGDQHQEDRNSVPVSQAAGSGPGSAAPAHAGPAPFRAV